MSKKIEYASMFTLRKDGRDQGYWRDENGVRHTVCDRSPEKLYFKIQEKEERQEHKVVTFKDIAEGWEKVHREEVTDRTWKNYEPHYKDIVSKHGSESINDITAPDVLQDLKQAEAQKGFLCPCFLKNIPQVLPPVPTR